ncbi:D-threo-aldose 1-dehydrogenase [Micromonospora phaseoli]|uniref:D-threo-aldose 1-dehydrogenase n=1 Tax=Micromonospora phaseoli TaxID=1144548 RepID=A0A1H6YX58_9ACTN|nr:aldo/keto reductase [Micromonospora phaseoli]PZW00478.1 D-threo-aldose 1-dehydrogenase [Micromonospora phaseoli]GIJ80963.1 oxidoreductase [Micromonospora phaseoli]SEJ45853.1 D-threo-aldose 1-dehydrogenase [Micromonospora phaseoli]
MRARPLPRRPAVRLTELGFGAAQGGNLHRVTTDEEFATAVDTAWEAGVRYFDTAPHYGLGLSERRLGTALRHRPRDEYVVSTKVGRLLVPSPEDAHLRDTDGFDVPASHRRVWDFSRDGVRRSIEASLDRTGLDRIDIVYLHDPDDHWAQAANEAVPALVELRDQGVVGAIGAGMNQSAMLARFVSEADIDVVMCAGRYTLLEQGAADDLLPAAESRGVGVVIAGVYNSGLLSRDRPPADALYDYRQAPGELIERARRIAAVCETYGATLPQAALAFVRRHPAVVSTVVGVRDGSQAAEAVRRSSAGVPDGLWAALAAARLLAAPPPG